MILVTVEAAFSADAVPSALGAFNDQAETVRGMDGCKHYALYNDGTSIVIVQRWDARHHFDAYRQSGTFAKLGASLRPLMTIPAVTSIAAIEVH